ASGDRGRDLGDVAHLGGEVGRQLVDVMGQVTPDTRQVGDLGLASQPALGAHLVRHPADLGGEGVELIDHDVDGVLELQDLAPDVDTDRPCDLASGHGGRDLGDVAHLGGEVGRHQV